MRINTTKDIQKGNTFLCSFRLVIFRIKITMITILSLSLLSVLMCKNSYAKVWIDSFDDETLVDWNRVNQGNPWRAKWDALGGYLFAGIRSRGGVEPLCFEHTADILHWNIIKVNFDQLTIVGEEINYTQDGIDGMGELCLFIGKRQGEPDLPVEGYIVSPEEISKVTITENGGFLRGKTKAWYGNIFQNTTRDLTLSFDSGHFQLYTNEDLITEFVEENLNTIDMVGLIIICHRGGRWFGGSISSISITDKATIDRNLDVKLQGTQLTTTWGELKRYE